MYVINVGFLFFFCFSSRLGASYKYFKQFRQTYMHKANSCDNKDVCVKP